MAVLAESSPVESKVILEFNVVDVARVPSKSRVLPLVNPVPLSASDNPSASVVVAFPEAVSYTHLTLPTSPKV